MAYRAVALAASAVFRENLGGEFRSSIAQEDLPEQ
jgi:hypothetical protein